MNRLAVALFVVALASVSGAQGADVSSEVLREQISQLRLQAKYAEAAEVARESVALTKSNPDSKPFEIADAERLVETLQYIAGLPGEAQRELALADSLTGVDHACVEAGRYSEAAAADMRQLEIRRRLLGSVHPDVAVSLNNLAYSLKAQGDYSGAEPLFREALAMEREVLGDEHPQVAICLNNLAQLLFSQGDYAGAEPITREALAMWVKLHGGEHPYVGMGLNNLAHILLAQGDYAGAEPLFRRALALQRGLLGDEHPYVAMSLSSLGYLLLTQGDYAGAEPLFREALAMQRELYGGEHPHVVITLNNLASVLTKQSDYAGAESLFREVLTMRRKLLGDEHPHVAMSLHNLAHLLEKRGDFEAAETLYGEALAMNRRLLGDDHPDIASGLDNLAHLLNARGDPAGAEPICREGLAMRRSLLGDDHPAVAQSLLVLATALAAQGDYVGAESLLAENAHIYDVARLRAGMGLKRTAFQRSPYPRLAAVRLILGRPDEAWPAAERAHARSLADLLVAAAERDLDPAEVAREDSLRSVLGKLEGQLAAYRRAAMTDTAGQAAASAESTRDALLVAESVWSAFQQEIATKHPVTEGETFPLERVQSVMSEQAAVIGWLDVEIRKDEYESWCYAIRNSGPVAWERACPSSTGGDSRSPSDRVHSLRNHLATPASPDAAVTRESRELWTERIAPLLVALEGVESLVVVPSGAMLGVPVEALVNEEGVLAGETYAVSYAPSATLHTWLAERSGREVGCGTLLVGDPPYSLSHFATMLREEEVLLASAEPSPEPETLRSALAGNESALAALPSLHGTRDEVAAIAAISGNAVLLLGPEATEQELVRLAGSGELGVVGTIHIATHALVDDERPERSALVLSQVDLPDALTSAMAGTRIYDGLVTAKEILREWSLNADLVTLSACETGLGKEVAGEGYVGFAYAFLQAGARSLIVSLWRVEDKATSLLMRRFYENRLGQYADKRNGRTGQPMSKAHALREAKRWLRSYTDEYGNHPYEHPYYWSAFILIGDPS